MKLISWNVNGLRACMKKGFLDFCREAEADVLCLQETKLQAGQVDLAEELPGYRTYWNYAEKKGYSGTAVFSKAEPLSVAYGFGEDIHRHEGRVITAEYPGFYLVCCYTPNAQDGLKRIDYRMAWEDDLRAYLQALDRAGSRTPSGCCTRRRPGPTAGGATGSTPGRTTPDGGLITSSYPGDWRSG